MEEFLIAFEGSKEEVFEYLSKYKVSSELAIPIITQWSINTRLKNISIDTNVLHKADFVKNCL